ncbi:LysE family translocator [Trinickia terrae]|uniref:LysE family translocator n=1 Tax=Trinickia terrae TaxID=2571161 RepID=A0A4U1I4S0_9BURK|nr:LysE family transporter [Trinickia terrae]TKC88288.1 LysE family translocator [Trinickia terrae]
MLSMTSAALLALGSGIVLIMPGPTNTLLAAAGLRHGIRRAARLTGAELAGYLVSITVWGYCLAHLAVSMAWLPMLVRIASSLYIAYLAVRMWRAAGVFDSAAHGPIGTRTLFVATLLNPKAILFAGTIFPAAAFASWPAYFEAMSIFAALLIPIGLMWVAFGVELGRGRLKWLSPAHVQRGASIVLATFSLSIAWALFR